MYLIDFEFGEFSFNSNGKNFTKHILQAAISSMSDVWSERVLLEHGWQLSEWLESARTSSWLSDVMVRWREGEAWQEVSCHSSVLAAVSPVLRQALAECDREEDITIISELSMSELLSLFYQGEVTLSNSEEAGQVWASLAQLGVQAGLELRKEIVPALPSLVTIMLGVDQGEHNSIELSMEPSATTGLDLTTLPVIAAEDICLQPVMQEFQDSYQCEYCPSKFATETNLSTHVTDYHLDIKCKECDEVLKGNYNLVKHTVSKHPLYPDLDSGESTLPTCDICKETFVTNQALKFHQYKHSGVKPYKCKICDSAFRTPSTLKSHLIQHEDCKHKCEICGMKCSTSGKLKIHIRTHTQEKPYQCSFCPNSFKQLSVLKVHEFTHTKKSNHKCDRCGTFFPTKNRLVSHRSKPICVTRNRPQNSLRKLNKDSNSTRLHILDELDSVYDNNMDKVTYFVQNDPITNDEVKSLSTDPMVVYEQSLSYQNDALDNLETGEIPVLVDNLPVIIHSDIGSRHLDHDTEDKTDDLEKQEMMFNL